MSPDRTSEDLPLPDVPTTAKNRHVRSRRSSSSISFSRPKKRWSSSGSKGRNPGNGLNRTCSPFLRFQLRNKWLQWLRRKIRRLRNHHCLMRTKALLLYGFRSHHGNRESLQWPRTAVARALLEFPQLSPHPKLVDFAVENQRAIAFAEILFMLPLKGSRFSGCRASGIGRSTASAPTNSTFARVVSK